MTGSASRWCLSVFLLVVCRGKTLQTLACRAEQCRSSGEDEGALLQLQSDAKANASGPAVAWVTANAPAEHLLGAGAAPQHHPGAGAAAPPGSRAVADSD
eukprot:CAMPEP_0195080652 /NCGR_PEP_ID=MMETSP0448-20130528/22317_1 /TAXON_ID=66468 /ORGANISM="Heterocapsa triquestra, Strain CCMP 448" /LENGTH=99 /DNA_ID=CAMNT_0040113617 /DNA_START=66 /DNA_END=362 /DNA_ORIENTATION=-